jgi:hypothetical protein
MIDGVFRLASTSGDLELSGFCCISLDSTAPDENLWAFFNAVERIGTTGL